MNCFPVTPRRDSAAPKTIRLGVLLGTGAEMNSGLKYCEIINYNNLELEASGELREHSTPGGWWEGGL